MGIDYRFNEWRISGEQAEAWSPMAYRLVSKNMNSDTFSGFKVGNILYLHFVQGLSAKEIRETSVGKGISTNVIKSVIKGFGKNAGTEALEAYDIAMYMVECEPEVLKKMYHIEVSKL